MQPPGAHLALGRQTPAERLCELRSRHRKVSGKPLDQYRLTARKLSNLRLTLGTFSAKRSPEQESHVMDHGVRLPCLSSPKPLLLSMGAPRSGSVSLLLDGLGMRAPSSLPAGLSKALAMPGTGLSEVLLG